MPVVYFFFFPPFLLLGGGRLKVRKRGKERAEGVPAYDFVLGLFQQLPVVLHSKGARLGRALEKQADDHDGAGEQFGLLVAHKGASVDDGPVWMEYGEICFGQLLVP